MIYPIQRLKNRLKLKRPLRSAPMQLVHSYEKGIPVTFCITAPDDVIQKKHANGVFYESADLRALSEVFPAGGTFVDIGANIGNHTLFAALVWKAAKIVPFEPNPLAFNTMFHNISVNGLRDVVDLSNIGLGLSDKEAGGFAMQKMANNLGGARMLPGKGTLQVFRGDDLLAGLEPDLIKIDVEGMELEVLRGLEGLLKDRKPMLFVEVDNALADDFFAWCTGQGYGWAGTMVRYKKNKNYLMVAGADVAETKKKLEGTALDKHVAA